MLSSGAAAPAFAVPRGYALSPGDRVETRGGGRLVIDLSDGSVVVVEPETVLLIKDFRAAVSLRELFDIAIGQVRVRINHFAGRPNPYRVNSPTASIAVRGTEFSVAVDAQGETQVIVYEGVVEVTSLSDPSRSVLLPAGRGVVVRAGQEFRMVGGSAPGPAQGPGPANGNDRAGPERERDDDAPPQPRNAPAANVPRGEQEGHNNGSTVPVTQPVQPSAPAGRENSGRGEYEHEDDHKAPQQPASQPPATQPPAAQQPAPSQPPDLDPSPPRATASAYDRYIASLSQIGELPFLFRYNAFAEAHLDSLENPAYATAFKSGEGRVFFLPGLSGMRPSQDNPATLNLAGTRPVDHSIAPQFSIFTRLPGGRFVIGGSVSATRIGSSGAVSTPDPDDGALSAILATNGTSASTFFSGAMVAAVQFGNSSVGVEVERLRGAGSMVNTTTDIDTAQTSVQRIDASSSISQTRFTAGFARNLSATHKVGIFFRYGTLRADDTDRSNMLDQAQMGLDATRSSGHTIEIGFRLRGAVTPKLFYGVAGSWLGLSMNDALQRAYAPGSAQADRSRRGSAALGIGYLLNSRTVLTLDLAGGGAANNASRLDAVSGLPLELGSARDRFISVHGAIQTDITHHLFASASLLDLNQSRASTYSLFPDQSGSSIAIQDAFFPVAGGLYPLGSRFSDFGIGWRFARTFHVQYLYSTDYGHSRPSHALMLRYTFSLRGQ